MHKDTKPVQRKLAAILAADIAGYSSLMGKDDVGTVQALKAHQAAIFPLIAAHSGRLIDTAGDGILVEFASAVKALECALEIQTTMSERNADVAPDRKMQFRIGVNLGDVIYDEFKVYGDGVNIAARLESLAQPGEICVIWLLEGTSGREIRSGIQRTGASITEKYFGACCGLQN